MKKVITDFIQRRKPETLREYDRVLREIIQHIALLGLWRLGFFEHAAFYGGTALRIVHGLPRFSEDIDFSLLKKNKDLSLTTYLSGLETELRGFGFETEVVLKEKHTGQIDSASIKAPTRSHLIRVTPGSAIAEAVPLNQLLKVKIEVDTEPPPGFDTEVLPVLEPIPFNVRIFSLPDLFAGKMHCVLCRQWRSRVKGRDWYDMIWFLQNGVPVNLFHLEERMRQSGHWTKHRSLGEREFFALYREKIDRVDFSRAVEDLQPFLQDPREIEAWGPDFFRALTGHFRFA